MEIAEQVICKTERTWNLRVTEPGEHKHRPVLPKLILVPLLSTERIAALVVQYLFLKHAEMYFGIEGKNVFCQSPGLCLKPRLTCPSLPGADFFFFFISSFSK